MARIQQTLECAIASRTRSSTGASRICSTPICNGKPMSSGEPSGPIRSPGMPGSSPVGATPASGQPNQAAPAQPLLPATSPAAPVGNMPADVGGLLRSATEYRGKFRQLQEKNRRAPVPGSHTHRQEDEFNNYTGTLAKSRHDLAALRDEFWDSVTLAGVESGRCETDAGCSRPETRYGEDSPRAGHRSRQ